MALITVSAVVLRKAITVKMLPHALLCVDWKLLTPIFISQFRVLDAIAGAPSKIYEHFVFREIQIS